MRVNKISFIVISILFLTKIEIVAQNFQFGIYSGFDISKIHSIVSTNLQDDVMPYSPIISYCINGSMGYKSVNFIGFSFEPGFIQKGGLLKNVEENTRIKLNYLYAPILLDIYLSDKLFFSVGPEIGFLLNAKAKSEGSTIDLYYKDLEIAGLVGINYKIFKCMDLGLRYNHGITSISRVSMTDITGVPIGESIQYNQYISIILKFKK